MLLREISTQSGQQIMSITIKLQDHWKTLGVKQIGNIYTRVTNTSSTIIDYVIINSFKTTEQNCNQRKISDREMIGILIKKEQISYEKNYSFWNITKNRLRLITKTKMLGINMNSETYFRIYNQVIKKVRNS